MSVPESYTTLNVYSKKEGEVSKLAHSYEGLETTSSYPVLIDNLGCAGTTPVDEAEASYKHAQTTTTGSSIGGHLSNPFQPFGKEFSLCLYNAAKERTYTVKYKNEALAGGTASIYLSQRPTAEVASEKAAKQAEYEKYQTEYKANEAYKGDSGYSNAAAEQATEENTYNTYLSKYNTELTKYNTKKTAYNNKKTEYEKSSFQGGKKASQKTEYEQDKTEYEAAKTAYEQDKTKYEAAKTAYELDKIHAADYTHYTEYVTAKAAYTTTFAEYGTLASEAAEGTSVTVAKGTACT